MSGRQTQEQPILPTRVALRLCRAGIMTRFGRSLITFGGVALGIAFLMSVLTGFHIKAAMKEDAEVSRTADRCLTMLRGSVGTLKDRRIAVIGVPAGEVDLAFLERLSGVGATVQRIVEPTSLPCEGPEVVHAILALGDPGSLATATALDDCRIIFFREPAGPLRKQLAEAGATIKVLNVKTRPEDRARLLQRQQQAKYRMYWIVTVSMLITVGGITNAMLMSVTERFREIATMKCLGALSGFVIKVFLIESSLIGLVGATVGVLLGLLLPLLAFGFVFHFNQVFAAADFGHLLVLGLMCVASGIVLAVIAGIYPAQVAAKMIPADALQTEV